MYAVIFTEMQMNPKGTIWKQCAFLLRIPAGKCRVIYYKTLYKVIELYIPWEGWDTLHTIKNKPQSYSLH